MGRSRIEPIPAGCPHPSSFPTPGGSWQSHHLRVNAGVRGELLLEPAAAAPRCPVCACASWVRAPTLWTAPGSRPRHREGRPGNQSSCFFLFPKTHPHDPRCARGPAWYQVFLWCDGAAFPLRGHVLHPQPHPWPCTLWPQHGVLSCPAGA